MHISDFKYHKPGTIKQACDLLNGIEEPGLLAGGTDLLVEMKLGTRSHSDIISLTGIKELSSIRIKEGKIYIGACATHNDILHSPELVKHCPSLCDTARNIATEQIRNTATVGGNLCTAASCCDMAPILMALDAEIEITSSAGSRILPLREFFTDHRKTDLKNSEILTGIILKIPSKDTSACYKKHGLRNAASIAVASVACMIRAEKQTCSEAAIVLGAVSPTPRMSMKAGDLLKGMNIEELDEDQLKKIGEAAASEAEPIDDIRGTAEYRIELVKVLTVRAIKDSIDQLRKK